MQVLDSCRSDFALERRFESWFPSQRTWAPSFVGAPDFALDDSPREWTLRMTHLIFNHAGGSESMRVAMVAVAAGHFFNGHDAAF